MKELSEMTDREIDARVAVDVMGWERQSESWYDGEGIEATRFISPEGIEETCYGWGDDCAYDELCIVPDFSTDIAAAWQVVQRFRWFSLDVGLACEWQCVFRLFDDKNESIGDPKGYSAYADTPAKAICLASLAAVRAGKGEVESR